MNHRQAVSTAALALFVHVPLGVASAGTVDSPPSESTPAATIEKWPLAIAMGGGLNLSGHPTGEATFLPDVPGPYGSLGYSDTRGSRRVYMEGGICLLLSMAAGVGYHPDSEGASRWGFHAFVGLPIPVIGWGRDGLSTPLVWNLHVAPVLLYLEPFYRPEFRRGAPTEHEVGLLLKIRVGLTSRQWTFPGLNLLAGIHDI